MRLKTLTKGGYSAGLKLIPGMTLTEPLFLPRQPSNPLEAATKQYVDDNLNEINASNINTGTLPIGRLPAFDGDVTSTPGSNVLNLKTNVISPGVYTKLTVNEKGLVVSGSSLEPEDIPNFSWNKITTDKPTTLEGYGITNGLSKAGGTLTGNLALHAEPLNPLHAVPKSYVDSKIGQVSGSGSNGVNTGEIIYSILENAPTGFLTCNGASVSKTVYPALFTAIGNRYAGSTQLSIGNGKPWVNQYEINPSNLQSLTNWTFDTNSLFTNINDFDIVTSQWNNPDINNFYYPTIAVIKNRVYIFSPRVLVAPSSSSYSNNKIIAIDIDTNGTLTNARIYDKTLPSFFDPNIAVVGNYIYIIGGADKKNNVFQMSHIILRAPIDQNGDFGDWEILENSVIETRNPNVIVIKNRIYLIGGDRTYYNEPNDKLNTNLLEFIIDENGLIESNKGYYNYFNLISTQLTGNAVINNVFVIKNKLYIIAGSLSVNVSNENKVKTYTLDIDENTGALSNLVNVTNLLPSYFIYNTNILVTEKYLYFVGGSAGPTSTYEDANRIFYYPINLDGTLGTMSEITNTNFIYFNYSTLFLTSNKLYCLGGLGIQHDQVNGYTDVYNVTCHTSFTGGFNDYTPYLNAPTVNSNSTTFKLPKLEDTENVGFYYYIKY